MSDTRGVGVRTVKHPILWVEDLPSASAWLEKLFGRPTTTTAQVMAGVPHREGYAIDYGVFHLVQETFIESIDPKLLLLGGTTNFPLRGIPPVAVPSLGHLGWYVDDAEALFVRLRERGMGLLDQLGNLTTEIAFGGSVGFPLFYTVREEAGLAYQFVECPPSAENARKTGDARLEPGWTLAPPADGDPLGIELCSHHTILTSQPERALDLFIDVLSGTVLHEGDNQLVGVRSTYVALGDGVYEIATPLADDSALTGPLNPPPYDSYHSMTFVVANLAQAEQHLLACGVRIARRSNDSLVTDPSSSMGVPWGFTTARVPGDNRPVPSTTSGGVTDAQ